MEGSRRIVVVGGVAAGPKAAARARRRDPQAQITIIEKGQVVSYAGCGLPYYISGMVEEARELWSTPVGTERDPKFFHDAKDIEVRTGTLARSIDRERKTVEIENLDTGKVEELGYDSLVLGIGSVPIEPPIEGLRLEGVFRLATPDDATAIREALRTDGQHRVGLVGAGLIGIELAEALATAGAELTIFEMMPRVLPGLLDPELARLLEAHLSSKGVTVRTGHPVQRLEADANGHVAAVVTEEGSFAVDLVVVAIGVQPNVELARSAGLQIGATGAIKVNDRMQTSDPSIYAGGDCVEGTHVVTGQPAYVPLGSTANKHGRVIGDNLTGGSSKFPSIAGTAACKVFDFNVARTGLSEAQARQAGLDVVTSVVPAPDRAHYYTGFKPVVMKVVAERDTGRVLGAQALGPGEAVKRIDVIASVLYWGGTVEDVGNLDLGYAPPYATAVDIVAHGANVVRNKRDGLARSITAEELHDRMATEDDFVLLDVRTPKEYEEKRLDDRRVRHLPLGRVRTQAESLPRDKPIVAFCKVSQRGYDTQRMLVGLGFEDVCFLDGGLDAWPYGLETGTPVSG